MPLHVSSTCAHHQEVRIALHSLWYNHTYRWPSRVQVEREAVLDCCVLELGCGSARVVFGLPAAQIPP